MHASLALENNKYSQICYFIVDYSVAVLVQRALFPSKVTREELNSLVGKAADLIRTAVDYKFILVLLFLKRLNDVWKVEKQEYKTRLMKEAGLSKKEAVGSRV